LKLVNQLDRERLVAGLEGVEFPLGTPKVNWLAHDLLTYMPFTLPKGKPNLRDFVCLLHSEFLIVQTDNSNRIASGSAIWPMPQTPLRYPEKHP
jgi:hypothetical protein